MRKALLENENVGKIAGDKKKAAFLRAIEDRDEEDEEGMEFLDERGGENEGESQDLQGATQEIPESQIVEKNDVPTIAGQKRKRPLQESGPSTINRPAPRERRSKIAKRPATLAEIRESLSFLTETPKACPSLQYLSPRTTRKQIQPRTLTSRTNLRMTRATPLSKS